VECSIAADQLPHCISALSGLTQRQYGAQSILSNNKDPQGKLFFKKHTHTQKKERKKETFLTCDHKAKDEV